MHSDADVIADVVVQTIKRSLAPVQARLAAAEALIETRTKQWGDIGALRERVAVLEVAPEALVSRITALEGMKALVPRDGRDADPVDLDAVAVKAAALVPRPENGRDAVPVDLDVVAAKLAALLPPAPQVDIEAVAAKAALLVPKPASGRDAPPVDLDAIAAKAALLVPKPQDGRDAPPVDLDVIALKAAALVPRPADGRDAPPVDLDLVAVKAAALLPVPQPGRDGKDAAPVDLDAIAVKAAALVPVPAPGRDGKDAAPVDVEAIAVKAAALVPKPAPGRDGKDAPACDLVQIATKAAALVPTPVFAADVAEVRAMVSECVTEAVSALPTPKDGRDGRDGKDVDAALLETIVSATVDRVLSGWPRPADGKSLTPEDVAPLIKAEVATATADLRPGADGVGIAAMLIDQDGQLQLTKSDGSVQVCGRVVGAPGKDADMEALKKHAEAQIALIPTPKDGEPGKDGRDGLGIDDLDLVVDEAKGYVLRWANGERVKEATLPLPFDRGVFRAGVTYRKGALVTAQGSLWLALHDTSDRPETSKAWRLVVKRGRDGKDAPRREGDA